MKREIEADFEYWKNNSLNKALLVTGARQTGKTYSVREFGKSNFDCFIEINFIENKNAVLMFKSASDTKDILFALTALSSKEIIPGRTLVFFDEVQECPEIITAIKFLIEDGSCRYILSGSLLGVEMKNIQSAPVGFMDVLNMYPLGFREFLIACGLPESVVESLKECFEKKKEIPAAVHNKLLDLFRRYLIVGGMPAVVKKYIETNDLNAVIKEQKSIVTLYKIDISKYDLQNKLYINDIYDRIPSELSSQNKKFRANSINFGLKFDRLANGFLWLTAAGVAIAVYCANEPVFPLELSKSRYSFKLFLNDTGFLASMYANEMHLKLLSGEVNINFGSVYENIVAQELYRKSVKTYYYRNNRIGEIDFLAEIGGKVIPIEVKSGKDYKIHSALNHLLETHKEIEEAVVFSNANLSSDGRKIYAPIYMTDFLF